VAKTRQLRVGNGLDPKTDIGPMIHERQLRIVEGQVKEAIRDGALLLTGGLPMPELGPNFYAPTVLADVSQEMRIMREETFGPVLPVAAFESDEQAIALANSSDFGLAASVWTPDRKRGEAIARRIHAGTVMVNDLISCFGISEAPHGGVKSSGLGRAHGRFGLEEMVRSKYLDSDRMPKIKKVWWYGYGERFTRQMEGFVDMQFARRITDRVRGALRSAGVVTGRKV
jgi:acyl-CoA reductase-like NAD-dependent aldehyde dehydrogenase